MGAEFAPVVLPDATIGSRSLEIYPHYMIFHDRNPYSDFSELEFGTDSIVRFDSCRAERLTNLKLGRWEINNDTLLFYQDWDDYTSEEDAYLCEGKVSSINLLRSMILPTHQRNDDNLAFPRNVSAFKIINHGDSLIAIEDLYNSIGIPISTKAYRERHLTDVPAFVPYANPTVFIDTLVWHRIVAPTTKIFEIKKILTEGTELLGVDAECDGITFRILNPQAYSEPAAEPFRDNAEYYKWIENVRPGQWLRLQLTRPNYGDSAIARSPYLGGWPDSVCVMDNEAYGYWFARPQDSVVRDNCVVFDKIKDSNVICYRIGKAEISIEYNGLNYTAYVSDANKNYPRIDIEKDTLLEWAFTAMPSEIEKAHIIQTDTYQPFYYDLTYTTNGTSTTLITSSMHIEDNDELTAKIGELKKFLVKIWVENTFKEQEHR